MQSNLCRYRSSLRPLWLFSMLLVLAGCYELSLRADPQAFVTTNSVARPIEIKGIHNAFRVTDQILSGSQPEGDEAFEALVKLGVKTMVSVDGSMPDVATAHKFGLRYVHLPFGYDGVPTNRVVELTKLITTEKGPFFVHCHHGWHRGPAAVAIMCEAANGWSPERAESWLKQAGTAADYQGLYRSAREFKLPTPAQLDAVGKLPELTKPTSLVEAMVEIDAHFDWLKAAQKAGWKTPADHPDISPAHEATMLWEQFKEIARRADTAKRPSDFRTKLTDAEHAAEKLRELLNKSADSVALDDALKGAAQSCAACHKIYRNK